MPTVLRYKGHRFFFYSADCAEPPHTHVETGGRRAKFWISPIALGWSRGYNESEIREIERIISGYQEQMLETWYAYCSE